MSRHARVAMSLLRQEIIRAGIDLGSRTKAGILRAVDFLAEAETEFNDEGSVRRSSERRLEWARGIRG